MSELYPSLSHSKWDCKYHVVFVPKRRRKGIFRADTPSSGGGFPRPGSAKGVPDPGRASDAGPRAHVHRYSAQAPGGPGNRVPEREERDCGGATMREGTKLYRRTPMGARVRRVHGRLRTGASPPVHPRTRRCGWNRRTILNYQRSAHRATSKG